MGNSDSKGSGPKEFGDPRIIAVLGPASPLEQGQGEEEGDDGRNESAEEWHMHTHHSGRGVGEGVNEGESCPSRWTHASYEPYDTKQDLTRKSTSGGQDEEQTPSGAVTRSQARRLKVVASGLEEREMRKQLRKPSGVLQAGAGGDAGDPTSAGGAWQTPC